MIRKLKEELEMEFKDKCRKIGEHVYIGRQTQNLRIEYIRYSDV